MAEETDNLVDWMERQYRFSAAAMLRAISATDLIKERPSLGQTIRPAPGSVLASREIASYGPNPDYFFHWLRDSAIVIDALRVLIVDQTLGEEAFAHAADFIRFSMSLCRLDGRAASPRGDLPPTIDPAFLVYVRSESELTQIVGDRVLGEARYNPDGTLDIIKWARPQNDGPALRALALLRLCRLEGFRGRVRDAPLETLLECDLDYTLRHWREPCFDLWEEIFGRHYYTRIVQYAALADGYAWMRTIGDATRAENYHAAAQEIGQRLDHHFDLNEGVYLSSFADSQSPTVPLARRLDIAVLLGVIHAARTEGPHSVLDPKALATLARLELLFATEYRINRARAADCAPAMGRYAGDKYYSGGAYYFSTLGAAQFYFCFCSGDALDQPRKRRQTLSLSLRNITIFDFLCRAFHRNCSTARPFPPNASASKASRSCSGRKTMFKRFQLVTMCALLGTVLSASAGTLVSPANVRSGPTTKYPVIGQIPAGADVEVLNCGGGWKRDWCQVRSGGMTGFVAANTLAPSGNSVVVAAVTTRDQANLHKGPGPKYPILAVIPGGVTVNRGRCVSGWARTWCHVNYNGQIGYVVSELLEREGALFP